ncbi:uncharacterized protein EDB91DRAFT_1235537 [Suillus paluster]|uniref:uncharacterized protein n=1 Tax=Suillus paluster TaxID=48578 RepID=UPI001B882CB8|nr:uncharacterized protein EDB91DRAFT_1235537 [Suillus paluster]KAG1749000.1 hypothetical protein EDB91DRAFT_1235537 [Suillus paluster]
MRGSSESLFTKNSYSRHLAQSQNPACVTIYKQMQNYVPLGPNQHSQSPSPSAAPTEVHHQPDGVVYEHDFDNINFDSENPPTNIFEGDYFNTEAEDLEWPAEEADCDGDLGLELEEEEEDVKAEGAVAEQERDWEAPIECQDFPMEDNTDHTDTPSTTHDPVQNSVCWHKAEALLYQQQHIVKFPLQSAGATLNPASDDEHHQNAYYRYHQQLSTSSDDSEDGIWVPFSSQIDYEVVHWAKTQGPGSTLFSDLLKIEGLGLSYKNSCKLNKIIDTKIPAHRPRFQRKEILVADIIECVRALYGDPEFAPYLMFVPEQHYTDQDETERLYHDLHTGKWWWNTQKHLEKEKPGTTIIPILLSSDKTQVTMFRNKAAYPVYMMIGNLPKEICQHPSHSAQILLAYLPTTKLEHITNKSVRHQSLVNLFHACMRYVVEPLVEPGRNGMDIASGDGALCHGHPLVACYIRDYPEQLLVTGIKTGECPKCDIPSAKLGSKDLPCRTRDLGDILDALALVDEDPYEFTKACRSAGIKPLFHPFWEDLSHCNIFRTITPDVLHQLYQGLVKHLISWIKLAFSEAEIDAQCKHLPPNNNVQVFMKGISILS